MIIGDENDLREQLNRTFEPVTPSPAPIEDAVRRGRAIRGRRRAGAVASLAVVAAVAVAVAVQPVRHSARATRYIPSCAPTVTTTTAVRERPFGFGFATVAGFATAGRPTSSE